MRDKRSTALEWEAGEGRQVAAMGWSVEKSWDGAAGRQAQAGRQERVPSKESAKST
jgi:hypothetical protein